LSLRVVPRPGRRMISRTVGPAVVGTGLKTAVPARQGTSVRRIVVADLPRQPDALVRRITVVDRPRRGGLRITLADRPLRRMLVPRTVAVDLVQPDTLGPRITAHPAQRRMLVRRIMAVGLLQRDALVVLAEPARRSIRACRAGPVPAAVVRR